jgi:predicted lipoprotein with Yx(FWY)xxD motif
MAVVGGFLIDSVQSLRRASPYVPIPETKGTPDMQHSNRHRAPSWRTTARRIAAVVLAVGGLAAVAIAPAGAATGSTTATQISTAKDAKLGTILVAGNTVYALKPSKTACDAKCAKLWTPVVLPSGVTTATAGNGVDASKLGTVATTDGSLQITYDAKPLYWYAKDKAPGDVKGNTSDKWGKWAVVVTKAAEGDKSAGTGGISF